MDRQFLDSKILSMDNDDDGYGFIISQGSTGIIYLFAWALDQSDQVKMSFASLEQLHKNGQKYLGPIRTMSHKHEAVARAISKIIAN